MPMFFSYSRKIFPVLDSVFTVSYLWFFKAYVLDAFQKRMNFPNA